MSKQCRFAVAAAFGLSLLICLGAGLAWAANPVYVDDDYTSTTPGWGVDHFATIQGGINAVDVGGTVTVYAGTYPENNVLISQAMTVQGAGVGLSIIDASASLATGNVVRINITSGNVLFDGFTLKTGTSLHGMSPYSSSSGSTITISHNEIEGFGPTATDEHNYGLIAGYGSLGSLVFTYNEITNCGDNTILLERHVGSTDVSYNTFDRTAGDWSSDAYFNMNYGGSNITSLQRVSHNTIDMGAGTVFTNSTRGAGISFASSFTPPDGIGGYTNIEITDNVIMNLKPYRRGIGLWNGSSGTGSDGNFTAPVIARNTILGNSGSTGSYGIRLLGLATNASITDNDCDQLDYGIRVQSWNGHIATGTMANRNSLTRCALYGILSEAVSPDVNGEGNWWGNASGPAHSSNPSGTGCAVSDYVDFTPWETALNRISVAPAYGITKCGTPIMYTFHIDRTGAAQARGYDVMFQVNTAVATIASLTTDLLEGSYLSSVAGTAFYPVSYGGGVYGVSCAILGGDVGAMGDGDLFTVTFTPVAQGTSAIDITSVKLRDLDNDPLVVEGADGSIQVDCTLPTMQAIVEPQNVCYKTAPMFSVFTFRDAVALDLAEYNIDAGPGGPWISIFSAWPDTVWTSPGWALPGFGGLGEGSHTVYFRVKDDAGNYNAGTYSWTFTKDTTVPAPPTNFVALPGHDKVHLTWTNPTGDASFQGVEIRVRGWTGYPQYGTPGPPFAPSYPSGPTDGAFVALTSASSYDHAVTPRDIYYYAAFSKDCAGNYSTAVEGTFDRSTSYWLGDIITAGVGDGLVSNLDLAAFAVTFAQVQGGPTWNAEADFGPTDDHRRFGIPLPDDAVNFEDLMIFAMNYGKVSPAGTSGGELLALTQGAPLGDQVSFRLVLVSRDGGKATYAVVIDNEAKVLKGFSLKLSYGVGNALESTTASRGLTGKAGEHFFGVIERESGVVELCVAALGVDAPFAYTGEVARVVVRETAEVPLRLASADLRDIENNQDEVTLPGGGGETPYVPMTTALMQNHPNPFNPVTTITYDMAVSGAVKIEIYDVSGSLVRTLVNGATGVGRHVATWDGRDRNGNQVHTGVYFYRMTAPGFVSPARKMLLLK